MVPIREELLEQVERGNVLLFIGERITRDAEGQAIIDRLTAQLAARCNVADEAELSFPEAAQIYEDEQGLRALVQFVRDQLEALGDEPQQAHRLTAGLVDCNVLVTTSFDRRFERAFKEAERPLDVIIGNVDVAFEDEYKARLYKLRGSVERAESLVLTEDDYETFFEDQASISVRLQGYLASKTILFVGYDLADLPFKRLYRKVTVPLDNYARRAYAFGKAPSMKTRRWCKRHGIDVVEADATAFLEALTEQLEAHRAARAHPAPTVPPQTDKKPVVPLPERPYKFLDYYESKDASIFFGRWQETQTLSSLIHAHRLVLLCGASGVGKTSLLLAGAVPRLESAESPYETVCVRALENPALVIRGAVRRRLPGANLPEEGLLVDFLDAATKALDRTLVIILDQFEEFFIRLNAEFRAAFIAEIGALYDARDVPVKVVLSLREDWLAYVSEIEKRIPEVFRTRMRLLPLSRDQARQAITAPVEGLGISYEPALVERLLDDLTGGESAEVMPPQLQIVCSALYDARGDSAVIRLETYEELGGAQAVLKHYLDEELSRFPPQEQALARGLLEEMVTSQGTRVVKSPSELTLALDIDIQRLQPLLERLINSRLIRPVEREDGRTGYEIAHEYLVQDLAISAESKQRKRSEEWLQQSLKDWRDSRRGRETRGKDVLIGSQKLSEIGTQYKLGQLQVRDRDAFELLLLSALRAGQRIDYWLDSMFSSGDDMSRLAADCVASALLDPNQSQPAKRAIQVSKEFLDDDKQKQLTQELSDRYTSGGASERRHLVDPLWELRDHLSVPLRARVTSRKTLRQIALHTREIVVAISVLILTSLVISGYFYLRGGTWTQYNFNEVGSVSHIAVEPENEHVLWALVEGGRYGRALHRSEDGGDTWECKLGKTTNAPVTQMVAGLGNRNQPLVYVATLGLGIYVFDVETGKLELRNNGLRSYWISSLAIDPEDHKTIYLGTGDKRGVYISTNSGESWQQIGGNALSNESIISIAAFANPRRIYVLTDEDRVWFGDGRSSEWKLTAPEGCDPIHPEGVECDLRFTLYGKGRITNLAADRQNRLLYAATTARLIGVLDNTTQRWTVRFIPGAESHEFTDHITVTGGDEPLLYVSVWGSGGRSLYRSQDRGQTWDPIAAPELPRSGINRLVADPTSSDRLYAASYLGAARTVNGGEDWSLMALDFPPTAVEQTYMGEAADAPLYIAASGTIYRSDTIDTQSPSWAKADYGLDAVTVRDLIGDPRDPNVLYAGVFSPRQWSVFVTQDRGKDWELLGLPPEEFMDDDTSCLALAVLNDERAILYAGTNGSGILRAELVREHGEYREIEWSQWPGACNVHKVLVPPWDPLVAYAVVDGRPLIRTTNAGLDWNKVGRIPGTAPLSGLAAGTVPDTLYVSTTGDGVLRTVDGGKTWVSISKELPDQNIVSLAVDSDNGDVLYIVTGAGVVYRSADAGGNWENIRENLDVTDPRKLIVRKSGAPELILASSSGIYYYTRNRLLGFELR